MKELFRFVFSALPFTFGLIACLASLAFLVQFTADVEYGKENLVFFALIATFGIPTLLFGIRKLSSVRA